MAPRSDPESVVVGVISDTHGLLRPEALGALQGSDFIIHAGDVGDPAITDALRKIAPLTVVRGNIDRETWAAGLPLTDVLEAGGLSLFVLHDLSTLDLKPEAAGFSAVIYGHSHKPSQEMKSGVLYFNPGSGGPRRFQLPISLGKLTIANRTIQAEFIEIKI